MTPRASELLALRRSIAALPSDVSTDAHGVQAPRIEEIFAPETHAAALDPATSVVQGARGAGKSFWAGVLANDELRAAAATAYPRLGLERWDVQLGFTGLPGAEGVDRDKVDACLPDSAPVADARAFWWATVLRAVTRHAGDGSEVTLTRLMPAAADIAAREALLDGHNDLLASKGRGLLVVFDALDNAATTWPRRRLLLQALFKVVWALRAWPSIRPKVFLRPDQLEDDALRFVELPKLRSGAVRLTWSQSDLYGLLYARLALGSAAEEFAVVLGDLRLQRPQADDILARRWPLSYSVEQQALVMTRFTGAYMGANHRKGNTYDWPYKHLGDAFDEVTPRSFLGLAIGASQHRQVPQDRVFTPEGIRHGLRAASKARVDQLHQEFPWIKGVLAPLAGQLLPRNESEVFAVWRRAGTVTSVREDVADEGYLSPFPDVRDPKERDVFAALERIGVMFRRKDGRVDMPDLFKVAARLLKKGGTAPL